MNLFFKYWKSLDKTSRFALMKIILAELVNSFMEIVAVAFLFSFISIATGNNYSHRTQLLLKLIPIKNAEGLESVMLWSGIFVLIFLLKNIFSYFADQHKKTFSSKLELNLLKAKLGESWDRKLKNKAEEFVRRNKEITGAVIGFSTNLMRIMFFAAFLFYINYKLTLEAMVVFLGTNLILIFLIRKEISKTNEKILEFKDENLDSNERYLEVKQERIGVTNLRSFLKKLPKSINEIIFSIFIVYICLHLRDDQALTHNSVAFLFIYCFVGLKIMKAFSDLLASSQVLMTKKSLDETLF